MFFPAEQLVNWQQSESPNGPVKGTTQLNRRCCGAVGFPADFIKFLKALERTLTSLRVRLVHENDPYKPGHPIRTMGLSNQ